MRAVISSAFDILAIVQFSCNQFHVLKCILGKYLVIVGLDKYREFGPIVRETVLPGTDIVWLFDPADIRDGAGIS